MRNLTSIFFVLLIIPVFGQSKKAINRQLSDELFQKTKSYDSLANIQTKLEADLKHVKYEVFKREEKLSMLKSNAEEKKMVLANNYRLLNEIGYDAELIIKKEDFLSSNPPTVEKEYRLLAKKLYRPFSFSAIGERPDLTKLKLKAQNGVLISEVKRVDSINLLNKAIILEERTYLDSLIQTRNTYDFAIYKCDEYTTDLIKKSDELATKWFEIKKLKDEETRREYQKELEQMKKDKKSNKVAFLPPMIHLPKVEEPVLSPKLEPMPVLKDSEMEYNYFERQQAEPEIPIIIEQDAEFPGGMQAMKDYLKDNLVLPAKVKNGEVEGGKVYLKFVVSETGEVTNVKVSKGIPGCKECDEEAVRLVNAMPSWIPGRSNGKPVNSLYNLPVKFRVD